MQKMAALALQNQAETQSLLAIPGSGVCVFFALGICPYFKCLSFVRMILEECLNY